MICLNGCSEYEDAGKFNGGLAKYNNRISNEIPFSESKSIRVIKK